MKNLILISVALLCLSWTAAPEEDPTYIDPRYETGFIIKVGEKLPDFKVEMTDGTTINTAELRGTVILIDFWATWCGPCRQGLNHAREHFIEHYKGKKFLFLPISVMTNGETEEKVREYASTYPVPMGMDRDHSIYGSMIENVGIPRNILVDADGTVLATTRGMFPGVIEAVAARAEKAVQKAENGSSRGCGCAGK